MSIGLGLFLGLVFCGVVFLYTQTKDRWDWGKSRKFALYLVGIPIVLGIVALAGIYFYDEYQSRPKVITEFQGVQLGESLQDATFKLGKAIRLESSEINRTADWIVKNQEKKGTPEFQKVEAEYKDEKEKEAQVIAKGTDGAYLFNSETVLIGIKGNKVADIGYQCKSDGSDYTELNGIMCGSKGDEILKKFGSDVRILCNLNKDEPPFNQAELLRVYDVVKYGTRYFLIQNFVGRLLIATPATLESYVGINWGKCS